MGLEGYCGAEGSLESRYRTGSAARAAMAAGGAAPEAAEEAGEVGEEA
jgi:hypothetical protein